MVSLVSTSLEPSSTRIISAFGAYFSKLTRQRLVTVGASWTGTTIDSEALA
jgi:hypothetical protein